MRSFGGTSLGLLGASGGCLGGLRWPPDGLSGPLGRRGGLLGRQVASCGRLWGPNQKPLASGRKNGLVSGGPLGHGATGFLEAIHGAKMGLFWFGVEGEEA